MRKPDFIGLGAQKAGTSWLHACLYEHPDLYMPASKETHFFSNYYDKGTSWYEAHFRDSLPHQRVGEFSPTYLYHPDAPKRIYSYDPRVRLIICLREPVSRALSAYHYAIQVGDLLPTLTFHDAIREQPAYLAHSCYYQQI